MKTISFIRSHFDKRFTSLFSYLVTQVFVLFFLEKKVKKPKKKNRIEYLKQITGNIMNIIQLLNFPSSF